MMSGVDTFYRHKIWQIVNFHPWVTSGGRADAWRDPMDVPSLRPAMCSNAPPTGRGWSGMSVLPAGCRVLVTGGTGSFGQAMARRLLGQDVAEVRILSRDEA